MIVVDGKLHGRKSTLNKRSSVLESLRKIKRLERRIMTGEAVRKAEIFLGV